MAGVRGSILAMVAVMALALDGCSSSGSSTSKGGGGASAGAGSNSGGSAGTAGSAGTGASNTGGAQSGGAGGTEASGGVGGTSNGGSTQGGDGGMSAGSGGSGGSGGSAGSGDAGSPGGGEGPCDGFVGLATPAEIALTPRADAVVERLALRATDRIVAPDAVYQRVERDLAAIRGGYPDVATIMPFPRADASSISMEFDAVAAEAVLAGTYTAWDCQNELYGFTGVMPAASSGTVRVRFEGRFDPSLLASEYENLAGVTAAWESVAVGDGNDISLDVESESYHWVFSTGSGDCPAGCISRDYWGFTTNAAGAITYHGSSVDGSLDQAWREQHFDRTAMP